MAGFISQSPQLSQETSHSFCFFSTSCLSSKQHFAPSSSCFSWLPLEAPEPITLESRFSAAPVPSSNNSDGVGDQQHSQASCKAFVGCPADHRLPAPLISPCLSPPPALWLSSTPLLLASLFPYSPFPPCQNMTQVCYGSVYLQSLS